MTRFRTVTLGVTINHTKSFTPLVILKPQLTILSTNEIDPCKCCHYSIKSAYYNPEIYFSAEYAMTEQTFNQAKQLALELLLKDKEKEFHCHVQFVVKVGLLLAKNHNADAKIIELSCLLHDIGRDHEIGEEDHGDSGARIAEKILEQTEISSAEIKIILDCIRFHTKEIPEYTLEQKIVITADCASKVEYHEAFMLLCKKQTYQERLTWGKKYLEKGYALTLFPEYKERIADRYKTIKNIYDSIPALTRL